jgi:hypothetical protein
MTSPNGPGGAARRPRNQESLSELMARQSLEALRWNWDGAYEFRVQGSEWVAERADGLGVITAPGPSELADKVHADYSARPVPRDLPPKKGR